IMRTPACQRDPPSPRDGREASRLPRDGPPVSRPSASSWGWSSPSPGGAVAGRLPPDCIRLEGRVSRAVDLPVVGFEEHFGRRPQPRRVRGGAAAAAARRGRGAEPGPGGERATAALGGELRERRVVLLLGTLARGWIGLA